MTAHIHLGLLHAAVTFASVIVIGFFWRVIAGLNKDNAAGQAMSFVY